MPANPYSAPPAFGADSDYLRRLAQAMRAGFGATRAAAGRMPNMGPLTAPLALMATPPSPQAQAALPQAPLGMPPSATPSPAAPGTAFPMRTDYGGDMMTPPVGAQPQPTISSSVTPPPPGQSGDALPQVAGVAAGGGGGSLRDTQPDEGWEELQRYWAGLSGAGPAERKAAEMRWLAQSMRGRGTGKLDWGSQLSEAIRGGIEGYGLLKSGEASKDYEGKIGTATDEYMKRLEELRRRRRGESLEQLSGPGME